MNNKIAYKGFGVDSNNNLNCRGYIFEVGKEYKINGNLKLCDNGFHFCWELNNIHTFYNLSSSVVCEIEVLGNIINESDMMKSCTNHLKILRILTKEQVLKISNNGSNNTGYINTGNWNTGDRNTGNWNIGDWNTGNWNTGDRNTGDCNTGDWNIGDWNTGDRNTGDCNTGDWNIGDWNIGDCNTGDWNIGDWNTGSWNASNFNNGFFNTTDSKIYIFNQLCDLTAKEFKNSKYYKALISEYIIITEWIYYTNEEKQNDKAKELIGGYLKQYNYKDACKTWWNKLSDNSKYIIMTIPNFDKHIFTEITGITDF